VNHKIFGNEIFGKAQVISRHRRSEQVEGCRPDLEHEILCLPDTVRDFIEQSKNLLFTFGIRPANEHPSGSETVFVSGRAGGQPGGHHLRIAPQNQPFACAYLD
jgi:hypothetical protein